MIIINLYCVYLIFLTGFHWIITIFAEKYNINIVKERLSNIELLRIVSMAMVLAVHFTGAAFGLPSPDDLSSPTAMMLGKNAVESIVIVGVNCFILISGFFGIRASWKGLANFTFTCLFASVVVFMLYCVENGFSWSFLFESLCVYSCTDLWFVPAYLVLYLLSPVLNAGLKSLDRRKLCLFIAGLVFINVYLGWLRGGKVNSYGYNEMQMIFIYSIGRLLRRELPVLSSISAKWWGIVFLICSAGTFLTAFFLPSREAFAYNAPFVVMASVSFFLMFAVMRPFHSTAVNWVASSAFMVYLLHKPPFIWNKLRSYLNMFYDDYSYPVFLLCVVGLFVGVFAVSIMVDKMRQYAYPLKNH